jgi:hypothetical protein
MTNYFDDQSEIVAEIESEYQDADASLTQASDSPVRVRLRAKVGYTPFCRERYFSRIFIVKCPFCAEEIKDEARLCRFCGAEKFADGWIRPKQAAGKKGTLTLKISGYLLLVGAALEIGELFLGSAVPLFGQLRSGLWAGVYHSIFVIIYATMGVGLLRLNPRGYFAFWVGTICFTLMKALYLLDAPARRAELSSGIGSLATAVGVDVDLLSQAQFLEALVVLGCWWAFVLYVYLQRDRFEE